MNENLLIFTIRISRASLDSNSSSNTWITYRLYHSFLFCNWM